MATAKTPTPRADKAATKPYTVLGNLEHDGDRYPPDSTVDLTDDQAKPLLDLQVVKPAPAST